MFHLKFDCGNGKILYSLHGVLVTGLRNQLYGCTNSYMFYQLCSILFDCLF